jgi:hypothetical protein
MKTIKNYFRLSLLSLIIFFASCDPSNTSDLTPPACTVTAPADYTFEVDGSSTVDYPGQTARLAMAEEILTILNGGTADLASLNAMYADGTGFTGAGLDESDKQLRSKTAGYQTATVKVYVRAQFDDMLADYVNNVVPNLGQSAAAGTPGMIENRELNAKGMEIDQLFAKGLIGALTLDQVVNGYLSDGKLGTANNVTRDVNVDANSTIMEHYWDEGFGYIYGLEADILNPNYDEAIIDPGTSAGSLINKYLGRYETWRNEVYSSFVNGRQAIVENCDAVRDDEAKDIMVALSNVVMQKAEDYLRDAAAATDLSANYFHALSEGYGFILSLQFTCDADGIPYFTHSEVNTMLSELESGNGFWDRTDAELLQMADDINAVSGL